MRSERNEARVLSAAESSDPAPAEGPIKTLIELVSIPSVSGSEEEIAGYVFDWLSERGIEPTRSGRNVYCQVGSGEPSLLLNAHTDTVPPMGWTTDPFKARLAQGKLFGLGACDTKASLAAMLHAVAAAAQSGLQGRLVFAATCMEEVGREGLEAVLPELPAFDAAVIGEPTNLDIGIAQRGIACVQGVARGAGGHAALATENPIHAAADDIRRLHSIRFERRHELLGFPSLQATKVSAGEVVNIVPARCEFTIDIRSTPHYSNAELVGMLKSVLRSDLTVKSSRIEAVETDPSEGVVKAASHAFPRAELIGMGFTTEMVFVPRPCVVVGPGDPAMAHKAEEWVEVGQVVEAARAYDRLVKRFLFCS